MIQLLIFVFGLCLFLAGIHTMSTALKQMKLYRMRKILNILTNTRFKAIFFSIVMTALIHSSSTFTILVIAFVSSGHLKLKNALWLVMGSNVGTTLASGLFFIDIEMFVYAIFILGLILLFKSRYAGKVFIGLSMLLFGLKVMANSLLPLQNDIVLTSILKYIEHPLLLVFFGIVICSVLQSSSACMAILLSFSKSGLIAFSQGAFLMYGFNIGTCLDTSLASLTSNIDGRKVAVFHLLFNIMGTFIFFIISIITPFLVSFENVLNFHVSILFALLHIVFNTLTLVVFICVEKYVIVFLDKYIY